MAAPPKSWLKQMHPRKGGTLADKQEDRITHGKEGGCRYLQLARPLCGPPRPDQICLLCCFSVDIFFKEVKLVFILFSCALYLWTVSVEVTCQVLIECLFGAFCIWCPSSLLWAFGFIDTCACVWMCSLGSQGLFLWKHSWLLSLSRDVPEVLNVISTLVTKNFWRVRDFVCNSPTLLEIVWCLYYEPAVQISPLCI